MKKSLLVAAVAALLAVPAAATAKNHPRPSKQAKALAAVTLKNSAFACKALRAQDTSMFLKTFGTNKHGRNAYGKCVSMHARAKHSGKFTLTLQNITLNSTGTVTAVDQNAPNCNTSPQGCTTSSAGTLTGTLGGTYTSTWTIVWAQATSNNAGGFCAPATGTTTLNLPGLGTIQKSESGTVCEVGATGPNDEHTMSGGTFSVASGTGIFSNATGSGSVSFDQKPGATTALGGAVTGTETFDTLALSF